jgi:hypothetical protein
MLPDEESFLVYLAACRWRDGFWMADQLGVYLDEFVFRWNRRRTPMAGFQTLLGFGADRGRPPARRFSDRARRCLSEGTRPEGRPHARRVTRYLSARPPGLETRQPA